MKYKLNKKDVHYKAEGKKTSGEDVVLLHQAIDLTFGKSWGEIGFTIERLFDTTLYQDFKTRTKELIISLWKSSGLVTPTDFELTQYHLLASSNEAHLAAVERTKLISVKEFPVPIHLIEQRISEICQTPLVAKNPFDNQSVFHLRVVRPNSSDNNPLHRDVWLEDYANCINLYIPVVGSNSSSSLSLIPGSHHWPENRTERTEQGAIIENVKFNVPAVTSIKGEYEIIRPDPKENEVLVFSPYLIHGGAVNLNKDQTRISIELRLWKKP
jgi:hypothetical protein